MEVLSLYLVFCGFLMLNTCCVKGNGETSYEFSKDFKFAATSSAYQIEGAWNVDGRSPCIWDKFIHDNPDIIADKSNADVSADSYHLFAKDVAALKQTGFEHYRFSISWSRVLTNGTILNQKGIDYYNALLDELVANGINPMATMCHFDLPQDIQDLGGFTNPLIVDYFTNYANILFKNFGDRVKKWIPFNEPAKFCVEGYSTGIMAPGIKAPGIGEYLCVHHVLQAHAAAYRLYKEKYFAKYKGQVGMNVDSWFVYPKDETVDKGLVDKVLEFKLGWLANPIFTKRGDYPRVMIDTIAKKSSSEGQPWSRLPKMSKVMRKSLIGSADFLALDYYTSRLISPSVELSQSPSFDADIGVDFVVNDTWTRGESTWLYSVPEGLTDLLLWIKDKYGNPTVIITANGFSDTGELNDTARVEYLKGHLAAVAKAIDEGCKVYGYTVWSIIDNFEWLSGYTEKFGIFSVDMESDDKDRIPKESAAFMKQLIASGKFVITSN